MYYLDSESKKVTEQHLKNFEAKIMSSKNFIPDQVIFLR